MVRSLALGLALRIAPLLGAGSGGYYRRYDHNKSAHEQAGK